MKLIEASYTFLDRVEMLSAKDVLEYGNSEERLDALRTAVRAAGIKRIARMSGVARSRLQGLVNRKTTPNAATIMKIKTALEELSL